jgi:hypothetical protein
MSGLKKLFSFGTVLRCWLCCRVLCLLRDQPCMTSIVSTTTTTVVLVKDTHILVIRTPEVTSFLLAAFELAARDDSREPR